MPLFFIFPFWLLCLLLGTAFCFFQRLRFAALYLIFCPTGGISFSILSLALLFLLSRLSLFKTLHSASEWAPILLIGAMLLLGGALGFFIGFLAVQKAKQWLGWKRIVQPQSLATKPEL